MTSDIGVERVVEPQFLFHCSCGATIETSKKKETCRNCGKTIEVRRCLATPDGKKYTLRVSRHRQRRNPEPLPWHGPLSAEAATNQALRHRRLPEYKPFTWSPWLLAPLAVLLLIAYIPNFVTYQNWIAFNTGLSPDQITVESEPRDCDWTSTPLGNKHCHYESSLSHLNDQRKVEHIIVEWHRVSD
jgi:hypothetical protein